MPDVQCLGCGYALKGSPTPVCPECGREWRFEAAERDARNRLEGGARVREGALAILFLLSATAMGALCVVSVLGGSGIAVSRGIPSGVATMFLLVMGIDSARCVARRRRSSLRDAIRTYADETSD